MSCNSTFNKPKLIWSLVPQKIWDIQILHCFMLHIYIYICIYIYIFMYIIYIFMYIIYIYIYIYVHYIYIFMYIIYILCTLYIYILYICRYIYILYICIYIYIHTCLPLYLHDIYTYVHPPLFTCNLQDPRWSSTFFFAEVLSLSLLPAGDPRLPLCGWSWGRGKVDWLIGYDGNFTIWAIEIDYNLYKKIWLYDLQTHFLDVVGLGNVSRFFFHVGARSSRWMHTEAEDSLGQSKNSGFGSPKLF